nr:thioredoxin domain-containing protein [uncultured Sellimonas sp.]
MKQLNDENFQREVPESDKPVLVEFYASWCGKCAMMEDVFRTIAQDFSPEIVAARVETGKNPLLTATYQIRKIPCFLLFYHGQIKMRMSGMMDGEEMAERLEKTLEKL